MIFFLTENQKLTFNYSGDVMFFVVPFMGISAILIGNYLYANTLKSLVSNNTLREKLTGFQTASIIKYAILEGAAFLSIISFMNDGNQYFLLIAILLVGWLIAQRPTKDKVERDLMLKGSLKQEFQQEDRPLA